MLKESIKSLLKEVSVDFSEADHSYKNRNTGELYTGTTTISGAWGKDFLGPWYAKEMASFVLDMGHDAIGQMTPQDFVAFVTSAKGAAPRKKEKAAEDGTAAHAWIESFIKSKLDAGELLPTPAGKEAMNAVTAFSVWENQNRSHIEWLGSEEVVCSDTHRVAGTLDALLNFNSILTIGDIKTSNQLSPDYILQLAGYDIQLAELGLQARQWLIIRTPKDGKPVETLTINDASLMQFARETFLRQREAHRFYVYAENHLKAGEGFARKMKVDSAIKN